MPIEDPVQISIDGKFVPCYFEFPTKTPASAAAAGYPGEVCWDGSYIYVCVAADTWKRAAIATW